MLDIIMGAQRNDGYSSKPYKTFTPVLQQLLRLYTEKGGSLLVSGAYIGTDMQKNEEQTFTEKVMHYRPGQDFNTNDSLLIISGMNTQFSYLTMPNEDHLSTTHVSTLIPDARAFTTLLYNNNQQSAAIAYKGHDYSCISVGFPIEQIVENNVRRNIMQGFLDFLLKK